MPLGALSTGGKLYRNEFPCILCELFECYETVKVRGFEPFSSFFSPCNEKNFPTSMYLYFRRNSRELLNGMDSVSISEDLPWWKLKRMDGCF